RPRGRYGRAAAINYVSSSSRIPVKKQMTAKDSQRAPQQDAQPLAIELDVGSVSALLVRPSEARACFVFAHGAGAGMTHPFMARVATGLCERGVASLRYQFPYMEKGSRRPGAPNITDAAGRAADAQLR